MGGKTQQSSQQVTIPPEVLARYNAVNAHAEQTAQQPFQQYSSDPNAFVAPLTAAQNQGLQATSDYANAAQPGLQQAMGMTANAANGQANPWELTGDKIQQYMNPYTQNVTNQMTQLMNQQNEYAQSGQMGNAIKSNAFGGDRSGIAAAQLQGQQSLAYGNAMAPVLQQGYNTGLQTAIGQQSLDLGAQQANLQRQMTGANQYGQLAGAQQQYGLAGAQALMGAGQVQQQTQQAGNTALYNQFLQQQSYPFQVSQFLANIAEGTGALSGQTTTSTQPSSFFSDRRLKENVKKIGTAKNGLPIHSFNYKDDPDKLTRLGFMADEVEKKHPEAVGLAGGFKTVDYDRAARASGGGIVTDFDHGRGYADGGMGLAYDPSWQGVDQREAAVLGNAGKGTAPGLDPYTSANRHVPKQGKEAPSHRMLTPGAMPAPAKTGLQTAGGLLQTGLAGYKDIKGMASDASDAYHDATGTGTPKHGSGSTGGGGSTSGGGGGGQFYASDPPKAAPAAPPAAPPVEHSALETPRVDVAENIPDSNAIAELPDVALAARGGRIGRDEGGGVAPVVTGAPFHGPDVVSPTKEYLSGLGQAQAAQQRANDIQAQAHTEQMANPTKYFPDQSPFGEMMNARGLWDSVQAQGLQGPYDPSGQGFHFAEGGSIPGGGEGLDIPDDKSWQQDKAEQKSMEPAPSKGGGDSGGGALGALGQVAGLATKVLPLLMLNRGGLAGGGSKEADADVGDIMGAVQREDDDDLPDLEREGGLLPKENAPLPPERPAGLGHALPSNFTEPDRYASAGEHSRSMAPEGFTPNRPSNPLPGPFATSEINPHRSTFGDAPRGLAPDNFTPAGEHEPDHTRSMPTMDEGGFGKTTPLRSGELEAAPAHEPEPGIGTGLGLESLGNPAAPMGGPHANAGLAPEHFTPQAPGRGDFALLDQKPEFPPPAKLPDAFAGHGVGPRKGLGAPVLPAEPTVPKLDNRVLTPAPGAVAPPPRAGNEPARPIPAVLQPTPPVKPVVKPTPPANAPAAIGSVAPLQPHPVRTQRVTAPPTAPITGGLKPSAYAPVQQPQPGYGSSDPGIPRPRNVSPTSPATIRNYGGWQPPTVGQVFSRAGEIAQKFGINPQLFQRMIQQESGGLIDNIGDDNSSFGVIQAHFGGRNPRMPNAGMGDDMRRAGIDVFDVRTWEKQLEFAARHIAQNGSKGWKAWTTTMRKLGYNYAEGGLVPPHHDVEEV